MSRDPRYDVLFEPLQIGPVTAKNRFMQVPHCNGGGYRDPSAAAEMRRVKAEGGWGIIFTEQTEMHHSSEIAPYIELRLWDDEDIPILAKMADAIHEHGALAGTELTYAGVNGPNLYTKEIPLAPSAMPIRTYTADPVSARAMTRRDIRDLYRWHRNACLRAKTAGIDLICIYAAHGHGIVQHFLSTTTNQRNDEYAGSLENRSRLMRELIEECQDAVGDNCAISLRLSLDEPGLGNTEVRELIEMHAELPDLWDMAHGNWADCSATSRFEEEAFQQPMVEGIRQLTAKPVVGVGRFTSPDVMAKQIKSGILDLVGCARPSIADPFIPRKIDEGRVEDIRECIGCNICVSGDMTMSISRCTQNPTFMEEWRKGWHPEKIETKGASESVLIVGAGPAGLEAARALGMRGYQVVLAEAETQLGGRVARERKLPGLSAWGRVADYREYQLSQMANVDIYLDNRLSADDVLEFGFEHVVLATGSHWRNDGVSRFHVLPMPSDGSLEVYTPDDLMNGKLPAGKVVIFDDDHYYMGGVMAELLVENKCNVTLVTPAARVSEWTVNTLEQDAIHARLAGLGVDIRLNRAVNRVEQGKVETTCVFAAETDRIEADALLMVVSRQGEDSLWQELSQREDDWDSHGVQSIKLIGDAEIPAPIAWATYAGHRYARELDTPDIGDDLPFRREVTQLKD